MPYLEMPMQSWSRMKHCRLLFIAVLLGPDLAGCIVTTREGPGSPPKAAVEERAVTKPPDAIKNLPAEIGARHLLVQYAGAQSAPVRITRSKAEAQKRAEEAFARAQAGEDFVSLVAEYSDEPGAKERGGSLGRFQHPAMVRPFSDAAFRLKVGQLSNVVETPFGYHVILRTE
jgi:peptidyl-prolyl cis-trans isomerase NIMA-interacting 1